MNTSFKVHDTHYNKETKIMSGILKWVLNGELKKTKIEIPWANAVSEDGETLEGKNIGEAVIDSLIDRSNKLNEIQKILQN